ncbi:hypothetical protein [Janthinobacterium sp.]|uniref:hypothetical protein n=1 Tax=Janthinobacterium sp. TaxID=1871054 RepID=UPI00293D63DD|nr:hypothetical protein [Janthinobacterium sp.]
MDDYVVWQRPTPAPHATHFAEIADAAAIPYVLDEGRAIYNKFLLMGKPKAFVIAPDGAASVTGGGEDPLQRAMASCSKLHKECRLYAVDDEVVW